MGRLSVIIHTSPKMLSKKRFGNGSSIKMMCENCGSEKTHPLASDPSKVICQICGTIGLPKPKARKKTGGTATMIDRYEECICPKCGCTEVNQQLDTDGDGGDPICKNCGYRLGDDWYADYEHLTRVSQFDQKQKLAKPKRKSNPKKRSNCGGDMAGIKRWNEKEDKLVVDVCKNPSLKMEEIYTEYCRLKPKDWYIRSFRGIKNRVTKLRGLGIIKFRYKNHRIIKCPHCGGKIKITGKEVLKC